MKFRSVSDGDRVRVTVTGVIGTRYVYDGIISIHKVEPGSVRKRYAPAGSIYIRVMDDGGHVREFSEANIVNVSKL